MKSSVVALIARKKSPRISWLDIEPTPSSEEMMRFAPYGGAALIIILYLGRMFSEAVQTTTGLPVFVGYCVAAAVCGIAGAIEYYMRPKLVLVLAALFFGLAIAITATGSSGSNGSLRDFPNFPLRPSLGWVAFFFI